ncbi:MAG: phosphotransferase [candidate division KSB1 bacterium]|nr:phosphotransferase [candidate division KSB1 bacterium]MDZ7365698.1 phosphotransferase [candidate division KSB1 bacterium]MDZ7403226.1 phosphotransferase [candidate division KSB1 bacterium]
MLENTLSTDFIPGTNLTGGVARAAWRFLLPNLELERIVCFGVPAAPTLNVLATMGKETLVISTAAGKIDAVRQEIDRQNVVLSHVVDFNRLPLPDKSVSLVFLAGKKELANLLPDAIFLAELDRLLKEDGAIYFEMKALSERAVARQMMQSLAELGFKARREFWLTPFKGELRTAFPLDDRMSKYLFTNTLYGRSPKKRALSRAGVKLCQAGLLRHIVPRRAIFVQRSVPSREKKAPPQYLIDLAQRSGVDLSAMACGLSARAKFNANKNIFYLFDPARPDKPVVVVKMTRAPEFNKRLENEYHVLASLHEKRFVEQGTYPEPLFFGTHAGLAILGQKAVHGEPFRRRTTATIDCPLANDALNWIVKLGIASSKPAAANAAAAQAALMKLYRRFAEIYPLSDLETDFLAEQIQTMGSLVKKFPFVFQHGDPGTWNMLASPENHVIVIDWEAGEPEGMPLWDLFYFIRTYGSWMSRAQSKKNPLQSFSQHFLEPSPLHELLSATLKRYCAGAGLEAGAIAPLFYTCWMHRALKEATRLQKGALAGGAYFNLLRLCIAQRNSVALASLFSLKSPNCESKNPARARRESVLT